MNEYQMQMIENRVILYQARRLLDCVQAGEEYAVNENSLRRIRMEIDAQISALTLKINDKKPVA